ncbi:MAG: B12-binding domain-containing radical SAM protein [Clostridiales bacterium]|nr:B12-binding domain-containing radical SAM protein [Clostridiales bacterium]
MKILLVAVNAKYIHTNLAVHSLRSYAKPYKENIHISEYTINHSFNEILKGIYKEKADMIGFSCYIWNIELIMRVIRELKKIQPGVKIFLGGPEVSYNPSEILNKHNEVDYIIVGEGEETFLELVECFSGGKNPINKIPGMAYREAGNILLNPVRKPLNLDSIPFPYEDMEQFKNKIIYYESSRGCPFSCSYCLSSVDKSVRLRNIDLVKKELKIFLDYKVPQVKLVDRTFNCNRVHAMEIWKFIKENDNGITNFHCEIAADILTDEEIELLSTLRPGQIQFEIGVQSTNPDTIAAIHRKMDLEKLADNVAKIKKGGNIHQHLDLIAGLPLEDYQSFCKSFNDVYAMQPDQLQLGFLKVLKGSIMEQDVIKYGIVYQDRAPYEVLYTNDLSYDEVLQLKGICEMVEVYYNSGQFVYSMEYLNHFFDTPVHLYRALWEYYEHNKLDLISHTRIRRFEILLDFYRDIILNKNNLESEQDSQLFKEILSFDLCLREAMKNRISFAPLPLEKKQLSEIYESLKLNRRDTHVERFTYDIIRSARTGIPYQKEQIIIFDYSKRDPLNKSASIMFI